MENLRQQFRKEHPDKIVEIKSESGAHYFTEYYVDWLEQTIHGHKLFNDIF